VNNPTPKTFREMLDKFKEAVTDDVNTTNTSTWEPVYSHRVDESRDALVERVESMEKRETELVWVTREELGEHQKLKERVEGLEKAIKEIKEYSMGFGIYSDVALYAEDPRCLKIHDLCNDLLNPHDKGDE